MFILNILIKLKIIKINYIKRMITEVFAERLAKNIITYSLTKNESNLIEIQNIYDEICKINFKSFENVIFYNLYQALTSYQIDSFYQYKNLLIEISTSEKISISIDYEKEFLLLRRKYNLICEDLSCNIKVDVKKYFV